MYYIDQSIKIENTSKNSYVCIANGKVICVFIKAKEKRLLKMYFRDLGKPIIFKLFTFAVLCAVVLLNDDIKTLTIDNEYMGHERQIKSFILQILRIKKHREPNIIFSSIGKNNNAHLEVYKAYKNDKKYLEVNAEAVLRYYEKVNKK